MEITEVRIDLPYEPHQRLLAYVSFVVDATLKVGGARLIESEDGRRFVSMPARRHAGEAHPGTGTTYRDPQGNPYYFRDLVYPIHEDGRRLLDRVVLEAYRRTVEARETTRIFEAAEMRRWSREDEQPGGRKSA